MSYYYKYNFISPEIIYSTIKEEMKSYFDTGSIDDLMFPTYVDKCLRKLGRASYVITQEMMFLEDFEARLPDNFHAVREAWLCAEVDATPYQSPSSFYSQTLSTTIQISPTVVSGTECTNPECYNPECNGNCQTEIVQAVYKTNYQLTRTFIKNYLLKPGNISAKNNCDVSYLESWELYNARFPINSLALGSSGYDSFDIRDNKFVTNFRNGTVYLVFYATEYDNIGNQLIPDNYWIREYIEKFIKFKMFETLSNQTNDETFNQLLQKKQEAKAESDEAYILAATEIKKQTVYQKQRSIKRNLDRFRMYELPTGRIGRRRN